MATSFVGRLDDQSVAGPEVTDLSLNCMIHGIRTQVLSVSIRGVQRSCRSWYNGKEVVTMPPSILKDV